ncbi:PREDICTED: LOW QUALITY PROTEIN: AP-3 complex subunit delta-1-like [Priapulus caudatus]|uniref:AP-3 complex subunit delta n=1 Tax=Priapulus caudatus TaxID=37621 RepID=A0ABM1ERY5_PRICU|nr:PREDICTED: LOW QUALITY PROTEIN: AP-3 complex subunit delta-1-like [Priapulus caudatus]
MANTRLKKVKDNFERLFDKNLTDMVRGIRNNKDNEGRFIAQVVDEIKLELKQDNISVKANAVTKLCYLQMLGYDISWAAFNVIEVMSSPKFTFKRSGYLTAAQCFHEGTDVMMLTTNMIRKDLNSSNTYDAAVALTGLSCFLTSDLARDLANDIMTLMASTKPYIRKKAILVMYKVFLKYPDALRPTFARLKEKLEDPDPGVQSAAVNVVCELARRNPKNYLSLAPIFFKLMTSSTNNWMLIKIIKLFGALTPLEPRLGKKLIEPLTNLIHSTSAMSLLYECINTVIAVLISVSTGMPSHTASIQLCVQKLRILIEDSDQNLKYLGLLAMSKILKTHPKSVQAHKDLILSCLDDKDESIRLRALDLLYGMVSTITLMEIVKKLMRSHGSAREGTRLYRGQLLLLRSSRSAAEQNYQFATNILWYVSILVELTRLEGTQPHEELVAGQMLDVAIRVQAIRHFAVSQMAILLENAHVLVGNSRRNSICEVLYAAAWICGEFSEHLLDPQNTLRHMLRPKVTNLPGHIQAVYVQNILKLYASILVKAEVEGERRLVADITDMLVDKLPVFAQSSNLEVQERACSAVQLLKYVLKLVEKEVAVADEVQALFTGELNPVAPKAQRKVPVPDGLDLDARINDAPSSSSSEEEDLKEGSFLSEADRKRMGLDQAEYRKDYVEPTPEQLTQMREVRKAEQATNPHYLRGEVAVRKPGKKRRGDAANSHVDDIPVTQLDLSVPLKITGLPLSEDYIKMSNTQEKKKKKKKKKKGKKGKEDSDTEEEPPAVLAVNTEVGELPEGAKETDDEDEGVTNDPHKALDIDLDVPLDDSEKLRVATYAAPTVGVLTANTPTATPSTPPPVFEKVKKKHHSKKETEKKHKREKKHKKKRRTESTEVTTTDLPDENHVGLDEKKMDDIEFWLSGVDAAQQDSKVAPPAAAMPTPTISLNNRPAEPPNSLPVTVETRPAEDDVDVGKKSKKIVANECKTKKGEGGQAAGGP